jgi:hypothetical protein
MSCVFAGVATLLKQFSEPVGLRVCGRLTRAFTAIMFFFRLAEGRANEWESRASLIPFALAR